MHDRSKHLNRFAVVQCRALAQVCCLLFARRFFWFAYCCDTTSTDRQTHTQRVWRWSTGVWLLLHLLALRHSARCSQACSSATTTPSWSCRCCWLVLLFARLSSNSNNNNNKVSRLLNFRSLSLAFRVEWVQSVCALWVLSWTEREEKENEASALGPLLVCLCHWSLVVCAIRVVVCSTRFVLCVLFINLLLEKTCVSVCVSSEHIECVQFGQASWASGSRDGN